MNKYFIQLFLKENTVILPGFGALALLNNKLSEIVFLPDLNTDDGKLASYISEIEGIDVQDAHNTIARFIREIEFNINKGESFDIFEFGSFTKNENGTIEFASWMKDEVIQEPIILANSEVEPEKDVTNVDSSSQNIEIENVVVEPIPVATLSDATVENAKLEKEAEQMDSLALIKALLNNEIEENQPQKKSVSAVRDEKKKYEPREKLVPIVNSSKVQSQKKNKVKKKRKFPFWFFFLLLGLLLSVCLVWFNFAKIKEKFNYYGSFEDQRKSLNKQNTEDSVPISDENQDLVEVQKKTDTNTLVNESKQVEKKNHKNSVELIPTENQKNISEIRQRENNSEEPISEKRITRLSIPEANKEEEKTISHIKNKYHIISGAFRPKYRAQKKLESYITEGYNAWILPKKIGGFYYVALESFGIKPPAIDFLRSQRSKGKKVWLLQASF